MAVQCFVGLSLCAAQCEYRQLGLTAALGPPVQWSAVIEGEWMI